MYYLCKAKEKVHDFDFVGSIFMSRNDNGSKPKFFILMQTGPSHSNGMARAGWLPRAEKKIKKIQRSIAWHQIHMFALVYVEISKEDGSLYSTFDGVCPLTLP